jgi:Rod binding domain-containing protein
MTNVSAIASTNLPNSGKPDMQKMSRAAHEFEAVLLNQLFGSLEHTFATLDKDKAESASDHYHFLGMQALASGISAKGGIGIADMIIRSFQNHDSTLPKQNKGLSNFALERPHLNF